MPPDLTPILSAEQELRAALAAADAEIARLDHLYRATLGRLHMQEATVLRLQGKAAACRCGRGLE